MFNWNKNSPLVLVPLRYGLIAGSLSVGSVIAFYYLGKHPFLINPYFDVRILFIALFLFFSLKEVRDYFFGGIIYFWQGLAGSFVFLCVMEVFSYLGILTFGRYEAGFLTDYIALWQDQLKALPPETIQQLGKEAVEEMRRELPNTTLEWMAKRYVMQSSIIGVFITIIISVILRRQPKIE